MTIEMLTKRIAGAEKEIAKLQSKIQRIKKAEATGWEVNPYYYSESDLKWALKDLAAAEEKLAKYHKDLEVAQQKDASRNVQVIITFLENWQGQALEGYKEGIEKYFSLRKQMRELNKYYPYGSEEEKQQRDQYEKLHAEFSKLFKGIYKESTYTDRYGHTFKTTSKLADGEYEFVVPVIEKTVEDSIAKAKKVLKEEADRKYDFIIERTNAIVGQITDASHLHIGEDAELNGYIIGTDASAKVQTIGAGGYNIQRFHFRTLIHKMTK